MATATGIRIDATTTALFKVNSVSDVKPAHANGANRLTSHARTRVRSVRLNREIERARGVVVM